MLETSKNRRHWLTAMPISPRKITSSIKKNHVGNSIESNSVPQNEQDPDG